MYPEPASGSAPTSRPPQSACPSTSIGRPVTPAARPVELPPRAPCAAGPRPDRSMTPTPSATPPRARAPGGHRALCYPRAVQPGIPCVSVVLGRRPMPSPPAAAATARTRPSNDTRVRGVDELITNGGERCAVGAGPGRGRGEAAGCLGGSLGHRSPPHPGGAGSGQHLVVVDSSHSRSRVAPASPSLSTRAPTSNSVRTKAAAGCRTGTGRRRRSAGRRRRPRRPVTARIGRRRSGRRRASSRAGEVDGGALVSAAVCNSTYTSRRSTSIV